jgi:histidinol-phosphate aminotransferase
MGLVPEPSDANFVLFGGLSDGAKVWSALVERGVLVRDVGLAGMLRVTAGTLEETTIFLDSLRAIINDKSANATNSESKG